MRCLYAYTNQYGRRALARTSAYAFAWFVFGLCVNTRVRVCACVLCVLHSCTTMCVCVPARACGHVYKLVL